MNAKNDKVLQWLLEDDTPGVQFLTRRDLLREPETSVRMKRLRKKCNAYPPVAGILRKIDEAVAARHYKKYEGGYWTLLILADLMADGTDARIRKLTRHVIDMQLDNGGFSVDGKPRWEIVCLSANMLRALVHFGFGDDERVIDGYHRLADRIVPHDGVPCIVLKTSLQTACKMTLPQTLRALAAAPAGVSGIKLKKMSDALVKDLLRVRVYHYARPDAKPYYKAVKTRPKGLTEHDFRNRWLASNKITDSKLEPKAGWLRFGFPNSYNPDLLEALLALAELGVPHQPVLDDALDRVEERRQPDGRWRLNRSLNGKMLADVEKTGKPSKWITYRALRVLAHFGRTNVA